MLTTKSILKTLHSPHPKKREVGPKLLTQEELSNSIYNAIGQSRNIKIIFDMKEGPI